MMNSMRGFASGFISKILMFFLVVSFAVWGIGDIFNGAGAGSYAARVGNKTISIADFQRHKAMLARQMEAMGAGNLNLAMLNNVVLRQLVQQKLITLTTEKLGLYVNDTLLMKTLREEPSFQNADGTFNSKIFRSMLQSQRTSEAEVLKQIKDEAYTNFLLTSMDMEDVVPPAPVRNLIDTAALETRDAWIVSIAPLPAPEKIDDAALQDFYEKNKSVLYMQPETRTIEYITLRPAQLDALVEKSISDEMVSDGVKSQPSASKSQVRERLRTQQRDMVMHDLQGSIDDALAGGATLSEALKKAGLDTAPHTLNNVVSTFSKTSTDDVTKTVAEQGFMMAEGETSGLVMTPQGTPVIVHVEAVHPSKAQDYENVAADVRDHVVEQKRREATRTRVQEVKEALNQLASSEPKQWQSVLDRFNLSALRVTGLKRPTEGKNIENGIPASLRQAMFEHQLGGVAGPLALESGGQQLAIVTGINHPSLDSAAGRNTPERKKHLEELSKTLNQSVQTQAFADFAERHRVRVNIQAMQALSNTTQAE